MCVCVCVCVCALALCRHTRIDEVAPSDCRQDASGGWTCFFQNTAKDCESGDIVRWDSQEEATKYPVQCRVSTATGSEQQTEAETETQTEGEGDSERQRQRAGARGVERPFSYQQADLSDARADVDPRAGTTRDLGEGGADLYTTTPAAAAP